MALASSGLYLGDEETHAMPRSSTTITAGYVAPAVVALADAPTIAVNAAAGNDFRLTISASRTMANPTNPVDGQRITFHITQGSGGGFNLAWAGTYRFGAAGGPTLSSAGGATDVLGFIYNADVGGWLYAGAAFGF
jgi:hypothetical protein